MTEFFDASKKTFILEELTSGAKRWLECQVLLIIMDSST